MIPVVNFAYPLYVNLDILESAGVTEMPATWSEFLAVALCRAIFFCRRKIGRCRPNRLDAQGPRQR